MSTIKLVKIVLLLAKIYIFTTDFSSVFNGYLEIQKPSSEVFLKKDFLKLKRRVYKIYKRTSMPMCDLNTVAFRKNTSARLLLKIIVLICGWR